MRVTVPFTSLLFSWLDDHGRMRVRAACRPKGYLGTVHCDAALLKPPPEDVEGEDELTTTPTDGVADGRVLTYTSQYVSVGAQDAQARDLAQTKQQLEEANKKNQELMNSLKAIRVRL